MTTQDDTWRPVGNARPSSGDAPWGRVNLIDDVALPRLGDNQFASFVFEHGVEHTADVRWPTEATSLEPIMSYALTTLKAEGTRSVVVDLATRFGDGAVALVKLGHGSLHAHIGAREPALVSDIEAWLRDEFGELEPSESGRLPVRFWTCGPSRPNTVTRMIDVQGFEAIERNYPSRVRDRLAALARNDYEPPRSGQLLLWYGPPGTGKTYALRALAWEWRHWCELHYVVDPDVLFGQRADYLVNVLLDADDDFDIGEVETGREPKWRLLVLEDTGELLAEDAKERTGQGLSRLLNLVDGIVGQGLRVLVLVTTNEPIRRLHPAVTRPGRCASRIEFAPFPSDEAHAWLAAECVDDSETGTATLAELFARLDGVEIEPDPAVGFRV